MNDNSTPDPERPPAPRCPARIRPFSTPVIIECEAPADGHTTHTGALRDYAYPGSRTELTWLDNDRRNFTGDWVECPVRGCVLPAGHRKACAS